MPGLASSGHPNALKVVDCCLEEQFIKYLMDSGLESGQSGPQGMCMWQWCI